jgi:dTDP-4-dehydrorhamnose reductase
MKVLVLGDGKLGSELVKQTNWNCVSRKHNLFNINNVNEYSHHKLDKYDVIVNCIANTNTYSNIKEDMYNVNFLYPKNLSDFCKQNSIKLVHISTDYIYSNSQSIATEETLPLPLPNWYTYSKLLADEYISSTNDNYLICRCSFKSKPFEFNNAWLNQFGNFDYVDIIAELIVKLIKKNA